VDPVLRREVVNKRALLVRLVPTGRLVSAVALALSPIFMVAGCKRGSMPSSSSATITGIVTDSTGAVLSEVHVLAGSAATTTGRNGTFLLAVDPQSALVVALSKAGYLESSKGVVATAGTTSRVAAALMAMAAPVTLDATTGGSVTGDRGASLTAGPGVLVDTRGSPVRGPVEVSLTPLSPAIPGELAAYPGALVGSYHSGAPVPLRTFGMLDVTVTQNGRLLQVAAGKTVAVTIPVADPPGRRAASDTYPKTEGLWSFNLATAIWDHEGLARLVGSTYEAQLSHFGFHSIGEEIHRVFYVP
jgi:hypothetical protein